jgi:KDO2-lipid IV(A) lauroyltransferase
MMGFLSFHAADAAVRLLPARAVERLGRLLARGAFALPLPARSAVLANLDRLDPGRARGLARASFDHFALALVDFLRLHHLDRGQLARAVELEGAEHLVHAERSGRGVIVLSAHLGNWEWGAAFLAARRGALHLVARRHGEGRLERFFELRRERFGVRRLEGRSLWPRTAGALRSGEWVAVMADRPLAGRASACGWAVAMARRTRALLLPGVCVRLGPGRYAACFSAPLRPERGAVLGAREALERLVARWPEQWCAFEPLPGGLA